MVQVDSHALCHRDLVGGAAESCRSQAIVCEDLLDLRRLADFGSGLLEILNSCRMGETQHSNEVVIPGHFILMRRRRRVGHDLLDQPLGQRYLRVGSAHR